MARIVLGTCGECGRELKVKEGAAESLMHLTCKCGWSGYVGYSKVSSIGVSRIM
jgi:hypothetical protein